ncbi:MAG: hypothetical protein LBS74_00080 [Oscillospiraceae bacterium]|jgi:hypothetical protein|nr:hypothetical protein [Oscillospiraceae bacterium]
MKIKTAIALILTALLLLQTTGCGTLKLDPSPEDSIAADTRTLAAFKQAFIDAGCTVTHDSNKPMFKIIGAVDAVHFYVKGEDIDVGGVGVARFDDVVKIYQYESPFAVAQAKEKSKTVNIKAWPENGKFIIETSNKDLIKIFEQVALSDNTI